MPRFLVTDAQSERYVALREDRPLIVGRSREADVHLDDPSLSRKHCEVKRIAGKWVLRDLNSFNGTFCNGNPVTEHHLVPGDRIVLGLTTLTFQLTPQEIAEAEAGPRTQNPIDMARRLGNLEALLEVSKAVSGLSSRDHLLELAVEKSITLTKAERGFLVLYEGGEPQFKVARTKDWQPVAEPQQTVSRSVLTNVQQTHRPVLTIDAQADLLSMSATIAHLDVRSLMCAPLRSKDHTFGCLYVDSSVSQREFSEESLDLLQAFADQCAIALDNVRLYEEMMHSRENEKRVRQIFQKYVPADVVRRALEISDGSRLSAKQVVTVLFSDIRGFTSISERLQPEEVVTFLNDYLQRMVDIVFDEGGIVDKFIGDAVMAVFGAPFPKPDDAQRAVRAAQRMLRELDRYNADQAKKDGVQIRIGIGVHTGPVIAGNIGSDRKMEYTVIGDAVNIASRVQDLTKEFGVELIITQGCLSATHGKLEVQTLPPVHVKGKEQALQVYAVPRDAELLGGSLLLEDMPTEATASQTFALPPGLRVDKRPATPAAPRPTTLHPPAPRPATPGHGVSAIPPPPPGPAPRRTPPVPPPPPGPAPVPGRSGRDG